MSRAREVLRREAAAVSFLELTESQRDAVDRLSGFLRQALDTSDKDPADDRRSRVVLVSGGKGCGKTSLVHSLRSLMESRNVYEDFAGKGSDARILAARNDSDRLGKYIRLRTDLERRFGKELHKSDRPVTWLETLSLDPMPPGTNLTAAVLARIHAHASREESVGKPSGLLDPISHLDKAKHELESLQSSAVTSLEGNLDRRAGALDADGFAVTAMDAERQKLQVAKKLNDILGSLAAGVAGNPQKTKGLFVLPVDDMDVRPSRAVQMLKLATMLSIPRLFFLFLGEIDAIDQVLFYETQGEYIHLLGSALESRKEIAESIEAKSNEIASSLLRKFLPPPQRLRLEPMSLGEALLYPRGFKYFLTGAENDQPDPTLREILGKIELPRALAWTGEKSARPCTLEAILCPPDPTSKQKPKSEASAKAQEVSTSAPAPSNAESSQGSGDAQKKAEAQERAQAAEDGALVEATSHYDAAGLLAGPPRQVADLWSELRDLVKTDDAKPDELSPELKRMLTVQQMETFQKVLRTSAEKADPEKQAEEQRKNAEDVIRIFVATLNSIVDEDPNPGVPVQRALKASATPPEKTSTRLWELSPPEIHVVSTFGDKIELTFDDGELPLCRVVGQEVMVHELRARNPAAAPGDADPFRPLGARSRVAYKATHDVIRLTGRGIVTNAFVHRNRAETACTVWDDGWSEPLLIPWSSIDWPTFWHQDAYTAFWNKGMAVVRTIADEKADFAEADLALTLLLYRVAAAVAALQARPGGAATIAGKLLAPEKNGEKWTFVNLGAETFAEEVTGDLGKIVERVGKKREDKEYDAEAALIDAVLLDLALLATPEVLESIPVPTENTSVHKEPKDALRAFAGSLFAGRPDLVPRFRRLRLERIGAHIGTRLGLALVAPELIKNTGPTQKLAECVLDWVKPSEDSKHYLKFGEDEVKTFFRRQERARFPRRSRREAWKDAVSLLG